MTRKILLLLVAPLLFALPAFAQAPFPVKTHSFEIGPELYYMRYEEPGVMENKGWMYGLTGSYTYRNRLMLRIEARAARGEVDYSSERTGSMDGVDDKAFEARGVGGWDFTAGRWLLTPYLGFGYRYLNDDSEGRVTTTGHLGYERKSNYFYSPFGLEARLPLQNRWFLTMNGEVDIFWYGRQKSYLSRVQPRLPDIENDQESGIGLRGSIRFQKRISTVSLSFGPFVRYWWVDDSDVDRGFIEPENNTIEAGVVFTINF